MISTSTTSAFDGSGVVRVKVLLIEQIRQENIAVQVGNPTYTHESATRNDARPFAFLIIGNRSLENGIFNPGSSPRLRDSLTKSPNLPTSMAILYEFGAGRTGTVNELNYPAGRYGRYALTRHELRTHSCVLSSSLVVNTHHLFIIKELF